MSADPLRRLRPEPAMAETGTRLVCTLAGPDGRAGGTLTLDLGETEILTLEQRSILLRRAAALLADAVSSADTRGPLPARWEEHDAQRRSDQSVHALMVRDGAVVDERELRLPLAAAEPARVPLADLLVGYETGLIEEALRATRGNRARAARLLQTTERVLGYRIQRYGIDCQQFRERG
jgi:transcriptional regulator with GAF, ATPase, and Fis domain